MVGVAGRAPDAASTRDAAACLGTRPVLASRAGTGAAIVIVATPDAAIDSALRAVTPSLEPGALVVHLAGSRGLEVFGELQTQRPDVRVGALHPLQSLPSATAGLDRLPGSWAAVAGDDEVWDLAAALELNAFELDDADRGRYHAAAVVASNHLVALMGQVQRIAEACGVPFEAFEPLARASLDNAFALGPALALTGPVARGDLRTVEGHLADMPPAERDAYRALAREAAKLAGSRTSALDRLLDDLRASDDDPRSHDPD